MEAMEYANAKLDGKEAEPIKLEYSHSYILLNKCAWRFGEIAVAAFFVSLILGVLGMLIGWEIPKTP